MKRRGLIGSVLFILSIVPVISCHARDNRVFFVETTDVHGAFFADDPHDGSLGKVSTFLRQFRAEHPGAVVLLDGGDVLQGQPSVYYYNFIATNDEHLAVRAFRWLGYDACAVGNHDLETGHAVYDRLGVQYSGSSFDWTTMTAAGKALYEKLDGGYPRFWLGANVVDTLSGKPYFAPYRVVERGGLRIAILGLTTPYVPHWLPRNIWSGMEFCDMIRTAEYWVPYILSNERPDLLVGLFHSGTNPLYNGQHTNDLCNENASVLVAERVPGFDIVFTGHDHAVHALTVTNTAGKPVLVVGAANGARCVAIAEYDPASRTAAGSVRWVTSLPEDPVYLRHMRRQRAAVQAFVSRRLGAFTLPVSTRDALFGDSAFMGLVHTLQLAVTGAQISFAAPLEYDAAIPAGDFTVKDLYTLYPYENLIYTMRLRGREVRDYLEYSYGGWMAGMRQAGEGLILLATNGNGRPETARRFYNYDSAAGIRYTVDLSKPQGRRIAITGMADGTAFDPDAWYLCAINSYRGNGGGGLLERGAGIAPDELTNRIVRSTERDVRYYMMLWIESNRTVTARSRGEWTVVPQGYYEEARAASVRKLFGGR